MNRTTDPALDSMYPYVVPRSWVEHAGKDSLISWEFSEEVHVVLVVDGQGVVKNLRPDDLSSLSLAPDDALEIATQNLGDAWQSNQFEFGFGRLKDGTGIGIAQGNWMAPAGALLLGNFYDMLSRDFQVNELAAVAVHQECLFAFPTDADTLASASLRFAIDDEFGNHRKPISRSWLLLNGGWPKPWPGIQSF